MIRDSTQLFRGSTRTRDIVLGADLSWFGRRHTLGFGAQLDAYRFAHVLDMASASNNLLTDIDEASRLRTVAVYLEDAWQATDALDLRAGVRFLDAGALGSAWLPRLGARLHLTPRLRLSLGGGLYAQAVRSMRDEESALASVSAYDILGTRPERAGLARSEDVVAGIEWESTSTFFRVDAFAKRMRGLALGPTSTTPLNVPVLAADSFQLGEGRVRGLEVLARRRHGGADFTLSYALSFAELRAAGESYVPRYERRHMLMAAAALPLGETGTLGARLALGTGQPYSPVVALTAPFHYDPMTGRWMPDRYADPLIGERHSARLPGYLRLDLAVRKRMEKHWFGRRMTVTPYLQVLNVLNSRNVLLVEPLPHGIGKPTAWRSPQFPILPTFGVQWSF